MLTATHEGEQEEFVLINDFDIHKHFHAATSSARNGVQHDVNTGKPACTS